MDNNSKKNGSRSTTTASSNNNSSWLWTDERHLHFLNSIEATFVRTMFQNNGGHDALRSLRLDRQLPDSSESTQYLGKEIPRPQSHSTPDDDVAEQSSTTATITTTRRKNKRLSSHHYDQVVPQLENIGVDDDDEKERDHV